MGLEKALRLSAAGIFQELEQLAGVHAGGGLKALEGVVFERTLFALQLGHELVHRKAAVLVVFGFDNLFGELLEGNVRIYDDWLHVSHLLQGAVQVDGVEDAEALFANVVGAAGSPADHLLVENAAAHAAEK